MLWSASPACSPSERASEKSVRVNEQPEIGAMQPRKLKPKKEQPEPLAVETTETTETNDDPFGGDGE